MATNKGLGKGLGALLGDFSEEPASDSTYRLLPIYKVEPNPDQPRHDFDEEELQALSESIAVHGVIQPLTVREMPNGYYQIIAGERRWRAARMANVSDVPVIVVEADDRKAMELALIENLQRQDLNPVEEALGYQSLIEEYGLTQEEAASRVGKSRPAVANALRLLGLCPEVLELLKVVGLEDVQNELATSLPYGKQRRLEIARALAAEPQLLLLDEPAAGMNPQETDELTAFIGQIRDEFKLTIFLIEHHMNLVMDISDRIYVLDFGKLIAEGTPAEIQNNKRVIDAYLGVADDA